MATEDLEFSEFYKVLQERYQALYERAQEDCWLVCIPRNASLPAPPFSASFVESHLLEPSRLYRDQFSSLVAGQRIQWTLKDHVLSCRDEGMKLNVKVVSEELAYNSRLKQYRMFIVDRPLVVGIKPRHTKGQDGGLASGEMLLTQCRTLDDHKKLLCSFSRHREVMHSLDQELQLFKKNYLLLEAFLTEAAQRLESIVKKSYLHFLKLNSSDSRLQDRRAQDAVWLSLESYVASEVHGQVWPVICRRCKKECQNFAARCQRLRDLLTPAAVGLPSDYHCEFPRCLQKLAGVATQPSPLGKLYALQGALDQIVEDVRDHFQRQLRHGEPLPLPADDLISLLATIIVRADLKELPACLFYMEHFHWPQSDSDKLSFLLVTLKAAVQFVCGPDVDKLVGKAATPSQSPQSSPPSNTLPQPLPSLQVGKRTDNWGQGGLEEALSRLSMLKARAESLES